MHDLGIIGAGPAGYVAAERAAEKGLQTVLFDKQYLGGVCLNEGCIPTKTFLYTAKLFDAAKEGSKYGIQADNVSYDWNTIMKRKDKVVRKLVGGVGAKMKKHGVEVVMEHAMIKERKKDHVVLEAGKQEFPCKNILVCTGSEPVILPIPGLERKNILTSKEILQVDKVPDKLVIIGGGVIGIEFANIFASMGSEVSVIEMLDEILPGMDKEQAGMLRKELEKKGVSIYTSAKVCRFEKKKVFFEKEGNEHQLAPDEVLLAVGRKAVVEGFGLEKLEVEMSRGGIVIDKQCRTNLPNVYAAGDVTGFSLLAHTASREAGVAVNHMAGIPDQMRYNAIPAVVYTNPELSGVGLTEEAAQQKDIPYEVRTLSMAYAGRFIAENEGKNGLCKILSGKKYGEILGVHMMGNPSSEMIYGAAMAIEAQLRVKDMKEIVFPHPTVSEIFKETIFTF